MSTSELETLMESMNLTNRVESHHIDEIARTLQDRLGLSSMHPSDYRSIAANIAQLYIEKRQTRENEQSYSHKSPPGRSVHTIDSQQGETTSQPSIPDFRANPNVTTRGRSPSRRPDIEPTKTPSRQQSPFFRFGRTNALPTAVGVERMGRSQSPFPRSHPDEKKETEAPTFLQRSPDRHASGRQSPMIDPSADQPTQPVRPPSPAPSRMNQNFTTRAASPAPTRQRPPSRPGTPSRPGLQEDTDERIFTQSPRLPRHNRGDEAPTSQHVRSQSFTQRSDSFRSFDDDDESVQQPSVQSHRKTVSETGFDVLSANSNINLPDLDETLVSGETPTATFPSTQTMDSESFGVSVLTPPARPLSQATATGEATHSFNKTGAFKMRRKGATPTNPITTQPSDPNPLSPHNVAEPPPMFPHSFGIAQSGSFQEAPSIPDFQPSIQQSFSFQQDSNPSYSFGINLSHDGAKRKPYLRRPSNRKPTPKLATPYAQNATPIINEMNDPPNIKSPPAPVPSGNEEQLFSPMDYEPIQESPELAHDTTTKEKCQFNLGIPDGPSRKLKARSRPMPKTVLPHKLPQTGLINGCYSQDTATDTMSTAMSTPQTSPSTPEVSPEEAAHLHKVELINSLRNDARTSYLAGDYNASVRTYTHAIRLFDGTLPYDANDTLAVLLSNRAAGFLMIGAYHAAATDCSDALPHVSEAKLFDEQAFSTDHGPVLKVKLLTRLGKAHLKQGSYEESKRMLGGALDEANRLATFFRDMLSSEQSNQLDMIKTEAETSLIDADRLREFCDKITTCKMRNISHPGDKVNCSTALCHINLALKIAGGYEKLLEDKVMFLTSMKRWREAASVCERYAASCVVFDTAFVDDLATKSPFAGVPRAIYLEADFFGNTSEDDPSDLKLNSRAAAEAVLRLPYSVAPYYCRALRLEERYPAADSALRALEELVEFGNSPLDRVTLRSRFHWLVVERSKLNRTKVCREQGDELFRVGDYDLAAVNYSSCMKIDGEGLDAVADTNAGGRLHAVLHCNRAACLMAVRRFHEAIEECSKALRIHQRYMKAMLRRSRCYVRLGRYDEAISEYKRWIELVEEARSSSKASSAFPCLFDGPKDATQSDMEQVKRELDDAYKAKRRADAAAREQAHRRERQYSWHDKTSHTASHGTRGGHQGSNAQRRRDDFWKEDNDSRRWDSFGGKNPRGGSTGHNRSRSWGQSHPGHQQHKQQEQVGSPGSDLTVDHYTVLELSRNASEDEIKRKYRKLALKAHPDKGGDADKFRRIKLAYETLSDPGARRQYDAELRLGRHY